MITLDSTLATAQDSLVRNPIISINSASFTESIPFEGQAYNSNTLAEYDPDIIVMSSGRLAVVIHRSDDDLILIISDVDKTEWFEYTIYNTSNRDYLAGSLVELSDGNLGIIFVEHVVASSHYLRYMVVTPTGSIVTGATTIVTTSEWITAPSVELLANSTYILVYTYKDGDDDYSIRYMTSSNFTSWAGPTVITLTGLDEDQRVDHAFIRQLSTGEIFVVFDYLNGVSGDEELINVYVVQSQDNGSSWDTPVKLTNYTVYGTYGKHPTIAERTDGTIEIGFQEEKDLLKMNTSTTGWDSDISNTTSTYFNPTTNKLYVKQIYTGVGEKNLRGMIAIDVPTWEIDKNWTYSSSPAFNQIYYDEGSGWHNAYDGGKWIATIVRYSSSYAIAVVDTELDTITDYVLKASIPAYSLIVNVPDVTYSGSTKLYIDPDSSRLYVTFYGISTLYYEQALGYLDLTEVPDPVTGEYTWYPLYYVSSSYPTGTFTGFDSMHIYASLDRVLCAYFSDNRPGFLTVRTLAGAKVQEFYYPAYPGFNRHGIKRPLLINNHVYGGIGYESGYGQDGQYGLMDIDLATEEIRYHRPSWATMDEYNLWNCRDMGDNRILFATEGYGITIFDIITETWILFNTTTLPGLPNNYWFDVDYDPVEQMIFASGPSGVVAFSEVGTFQQLKYMTGTYTTSWSYGTVATLANTYVNSQAAIAIDSENVMWATWTHRDVLEYSTYWDQEIAEKDLSDYLTNSPVTVNWDVVSPASLSFTLSHGHLFDPSNSMSTLAPFIKKGRKIELQFGERISSTDYFQNQGFFIVASTSLSYRKGEYPVIVVQCEDYREIWRQGRIPVSSYYSNQYPETILSDLLQEHAEIDSGDINFPTFAGRHTLYHQFIDQELTKMIELIMDHFNYFFYVSVDGEYTAKRIRISGDADHSYTGSELINYTPDDNYSSFLNRIIVKGEGLYELEVLYPVEIVGLLNGTIGWWGGETIKRVYYSEDRERRVRDPYLNINISVQEFEVFTIEGGGKEYISGDDPDEYWVEITIEAPDLTGVFLGVAIAILAVGAMAITCTACGPYIFALSILTQIMGYLLGSIAQYDYEIWGSPIGATKQTFQMSADDLIFQRQLNGLVVSEEIDDPFCYTMTQCQTVADNELAVVMAQRKRVSWEKIAHLQDEIGDIIQIQHPYTGLDIKMFIPTLTRTYQKGVGIFDKLSGWLL